MITYTHPVIYLVVAYKNLVARQTVSIFEVMRFLNSQSLIPPPPFVVCNLYSIAVRIGMIYLRSGSNH